MARPTFNTTPLHPLINDFGWGVPELTSLGIGRRIAERAVVEAGPVAIRAAGQEVPVPGTNAFQAALAAAGLPVPTAEVTSVVATENLARDTLAARMYLRARSQGKFIRPQATHIAFSTRTVLDREFRILGHGLAPSASTQLTFSDPSVQQVYAAGIAQIGPILQSKWPGPVDVFVLGEVTVLRIITGETPIRGTRSYDRAWLHSRKNLNVGDPTV